MKTINNKLTKRALSILAIAGLSCSTAQAFTIKPSDLGGIAFVITPGLVREKGFARELLLGSAAASSVYAIVAAYYKGKSLLSEKTEDGIENPADKAALENFYAAVAWGCIAVITKATTYCLSK